MQGMDKEASVFLRDYPCYSKFASKIYKYLSNIHPKPINKQALVPQFWLFRGETTGIFAYEAEKLRHFTLNGS